MFYGTHALLVSPLTDIAESSGGVRPAAAGAGAAAAVAAAAVCHVRRGSALGVAPVVA